MSLFAKSTYEFHVSSHSPKFLSAPNFKGLFFHNQEACPLHRLRPYSHSSSRLELSLSYLQELKVSFCNRTYLARSCHQPFTDQARGGDSHERSSNISLGCSRTICKLLCTYWSAFPSWVFSEWTGRGLDKVRSDEPVFNPKSTIPSALHLSRTS